MIINYFLKTILLIFIATAAFMDTKSRTIPVVFLGISFCCGFILQTMNVANNQTELYELLLGFLPGLFLLIIAKLSSQAVGYGDGFMFIATGAFLGLSDNITLLLFSLVPAALFSIIVLIVKKFRKNRSFPFIPCVLLGYVGMLALN